MTGRTLKILFVTLFSLIIGGMAHAAGIEASNARVRLVPPGREVTAAFLVLRNTGQTDCELNKVSSDIAERGEIHQHVHDTGVMHMRRVEMLEIGAGETLEFAPGGYHIMLFGLRGPLQPGQSANIQFGFGNCPAVSVTAEVVDPRTGSLE